MHNQHLFVFIFKWLWLCTTCGYQLTREEYPSWVGYGLEVQDLQVYLYRSLCLDTDLCLLPSQLLLVVVITF